MKDQADIIKMMEGKSSIINGLDFCILNKALKLLYKNSKKFEEDYENTRVTETDDLVTIEVSFHKINQMFGIFHDIDEEIKDDEEREVEYKIDNDWESEKGV